MKFASHPICELLPRIMCTFGFELELKEIPGGDVTERSRKIEKEKNRVSNMKSI